MRRRVPFAVPSAVFAIVLGLVVIEAAGVPQGVSGLSVSVGTQPSQPQPTGTGRVSVTLVASDNGAPIRRTRVTLTGSARPQEGAAPPRSALEAAALRVQREGDTDEAGRVEFSGLPAGRYAIFPAVATGFVRPTRSESLSLGEGEALARTIRLDRTGAITGRILDEAGEPVAHVMVRASRKRTGLGSGSSGGMGSGTQSDDRGQFRLFDLAPGDYLVSATPMRPYSAASSLADPGEVRVGYVPTWFGGVTAMEDARAVTVRSGQDTPDVEIALQRARLGRVVGTAVDSEGRPLSPSGRASVMLGQQTIDGSNAHGTQLKPDGSFVFADVPPGRYYVQASRSLDPGPSPNREEAFEMVTVDGNEVAVSLRTNKGATLAGRVVREGSAPPAAVPGDMRQVTLASPGYRMAVSVSPVRTSNGLPTTYGGTARPTPVDEDGKFELTGVRGSVQLTVTAGPGALKSIRSGIRDLTLGPLELKGTEHFDDIEIVVTTDTGMLRGTVMDGRGQPATEAQVIVFPEEPRRWYQMSPFVRIGMTSPARPGGPVATNSLTPISPAGASMGAATRTAGSVGPGSFAVPSLVPGRYYVAAIAPEERLSPFTLDRELLDGLRTHATVVIVETHQITTVELHVTK